MVAFCGMVVDDVEHDLDAGIMQARDGCAENVEWVFLSVPRFRSEEGDGVVTPIIDELFLDELAVVNEAVNRQKLDRRDAKALEVLDHGW